MSSDVWHIIGDVGVILWCAWATIHIHFLRKRLERLEPTDFGHKLMHAGDAHHARMILNILRLG